MNKKTIQFNASSAPIVYVRGWAGSRNTEVKCTGVSKENETDGNIKNNINVNKKSYAKVASDDAADIGERGKNTKSKQINVNFVSPIRRE